MWEKLGGLFDKQEVAADEVDLRHAVERWLDKVAGVGDVRCTAVNNQTVTVHCESPVAVQEVKLRQFELADFLATEFSFTVKKLVVRS